MEPYQRASQKLREGKEAPYNALKNVASAVVGGGAAAVGAKAASKIMPAVGAMLSKYVPEKFSIEGLKKINPAFGKFIQEGLDSGYTYDELKDFMGEKVQKSQEQAKPAQNKKNIIEEHSPELHQFIDQEIKKGRSPLQAGALAVQERTGRPDFKKVIDKLIKQHKTDWPSILEAVYGASQSTNNAGNTQQNTSNQPPSVQNPSMQQSPQQMQQPQQAQQVGPGQQALIAALGKIPKRSVK